ncbi:hypothetical protein GGI20_005098, partial [Coemansia sp. BCRC 34301]
MSEDHDEDDGNIDDGGGGGAAGLASYLSDLRGRKAATAAEALESAPLPGKVASPSATDNEPHMIDMLLQAYRQMLDVPQKINRKFCTGVWDSVRRRVSVARPVDTVSRILGRTEAGHTVLQPEEWLLHFQHGILAITPGHGYELEKAFSSQDAWNTAVGEAGLDLDSFRIYAFLRRLGYIVVCPVRDGLLPLASNSLICARQEPLQKTSVGDDDRAPLFAY